MTSRPRGPDRLVLLTFGLFSLASLPGIRSCHPLEGQVLSGRVVEQGRDTPISGAMIALVDLQGRQSVAVVADSAGRYLLHASEPGEFVIEVRHFGYQTLESPLIAFSADDSAILDLELTPDAVEVDGLEVVVEREAVRELRGMGLNPSRLGGRWLGRDDITAIPGLPGVLGTLRSRGVPGMSLPTNPHALCVRFRRGDGCALVNYNGTRLRLDAALDLPTDALGAVAILTPEEATTLYGPDGRNGAVLLWGR